MEEHRVSELVATGIPGLDDILNGGLTAGKMYLLAGGPGTGKTTFALQFIGEGIRRRERCLYVTIASEQGDFLGQAQAIGFSLDPVFFNLLRVEVSEKSLDGPEKTIFHPLDMEMAELMKGVVAEVKRLKPQRLVIDSLADLRILSNNIINYQRLIFSLLREVGTGGCTVLFTNYGEFNEIDQLLEATVHGVMHIEQLSRDYGPTRRRFSILKLRERNYRSGWHDFKITSGGINIYPSLKVGSSQKIQKEQFSSGNVELDSLICGGLDRGGSTAIIGSSGTGKTTLANLFGVAACGRGEHTVFYLFEETVDSFMQRAECLGMPVGAFVDQGLMTLRHINVAELSPGEFAAMIKEEVEVKSAKVIVIDTLSGYASAMPEESYLTLQLHEILLYLTGKGVTTFLTIEQPGIFGKEEEVKNVSYLSDNILYLRFFEYKGQLRRALSVIKKRRGKHETGIRELSFSETGVHIGEPLTEMQGVLTGVPVLEKRR